jgi:hypothetical protein
MIARPLLDAEIPNIVAQVLNTSRLLILNWKCEPPSLQHVHAIGVEVERFRPDLAGPQILLGVVDSSNTSQPYGDLIPPNPARMAAELIASRPITPFGMPDRDLFRTGLCLCERDPPNATRSAAYE